MQKKPLIQMRCVKGNWVVRMPRSGPGGPPCEDDPANNGTCSANVGHCLQMTEAGMKMDKDCPGTCGK